MEAPPPNPSPPFTTPAHTYYTIFIVVSLKLLKKAKIERDT